jgi:AraC-like DNA-binding protein
VVTLVADPVLRERIRVTLDGHCPVFMARDGVECVELIRREAVTCAILDVGIPLSLSLASLIRGVRAQAPHAHIIGYGCPEQNLAAPLIAAARAGIDDLVFRGDRDMAVLRESVLHAEQVSDHGMDDLLARLSLSVPRMLHALLRESVPLVSADRSVTALAAALHSHRNTLAGRLARAGGPTPERFRAWCLLLRVGHLLDLTSFSVERIAFHLKFTSSSALSHLVSRYLRITPTRLRHAGAVQLIVQRFVAECGRPKRCGGIE